MCQRPSKWFVDWLLRHQPYSPQPYEQCAKVLREAGQPDKANAVLFAGKVRERRETAWKDDKLRWLWLWIMQLSVGYGLGWRYVWSLAWAGILVAIGAWWLDGTPVGCLDGTPETQVMMVMTTGQRGMYSLGAFLPAITLEEWHKKIELFGGALAYFTFMKLAGYGLISLVVAGMAGVLRK